MNACPFIIEHEIARGNIPGVSQERKFAYNANVDTNAYPLWAVGTAYTWPTTAVALTAESSDNINDKAGGTGALVILIAGLNAAFDPINELVTLNGTTQVSTSQSFSRVNRVAVAVAGEYGGSNAGNITIKHGDNIVAYVPAGLSITQQSILTIPRGHTAVVEDIRLTVESTKIANLFYWLRVNADRVTPPFSPFALVDSNYGVIGTDNRGTNIAIPEKTDILITAAVTSGSGKVSINYRYDLYKN